MRSLLAALLGLVACLVLPVAVASVWLAEVAADTPTYVDTVGPLAEDRVVRETAAERVEAEVRRQFGLPEQASPLVHEAVVRVVEGEEFPPLWRAANREAHQQLVVLLEDDREGAVRLRLRPVAEAVVDDLAGEGLLRSAGVSVPEVDITVATSDDLAEARTTYRLLEAAGFWLPVAWVVLVALTALVARRRVGSLAFLAAGSAAALGLGWLILGGVREGVVDHVPARDQELAGAVWDVVTSSLSTSLVSLALGALAAAVVLALLGTGVRRARG